MNVKDSIKKVGAVAASTLMVGMTMGAAQSLSEFPGMFVDDEGSPTAQVVVGSQGAVSDVVGAVNVAAALGQATIQTSEMTEEVDVETSGSVGWDAGEGQVLATQNDNLYFSDTIDEVRATLTEEHLDALQTVEFTDDAGNSQDVEHYLYVGDEPVQFGTLGDQDDEDPALHVNNPAEPSDVDNGLYKLQANFGEGLDITEDPNTASDDGNADVLGEEIELFGKTFTISEDSFDSNHAGQLVLFGSSEEYDLETGESTTFEVNGEEHTLEVRAVTDSDTAAFYLDGELRERDEGQTFNVDGTDVRVDNVIQTASDTSEGLVTFSIGSEEYVFEHDEPVQDGDGDDIEGTEVAMSGNNYDGSVGDSDGQISISSLEVGVGADDSDNGYVAAGETFEDPLFEEIQFHFGGLAPDASEVGDGVAELDFSADGDDVATVSFDDGDNSASIDYFSADSDPALGDEDGDLIHVYEGAEVEEDEYFLSDAGDFDHMWEVTGIDVAGAVDGEDTTVDLTDVVSGSDVEVDIESDGTETYTGTEVIDGQTYTFAIDETNGDHGDNPTVSATYSDAGTTHVYPALDTDSGAGVTFVDDVDDVVDSSGDTTGAADAVTETLVFPSTESSGTQSVDVDIGNYGNTAANEIEVVVGDRASQSIATSETATFEDVEVGAGTYDVMVDFDNDPDTDGQEAEYSIDVSPVNPSDDSELTEPAAMALQPQDDDDNEGNFLVVPGYDTGDDEMDITTGEGEVYDGSGTWSGTSLESEDDVSVGYNTYGTYAREDTDEQGQFTLHVPDQQSIAGAAFTGSGGSLDMSGTSTGSGEVTYTGVTNEDIRGALPDLAKTDDQVTSSDRQNSHLILVGGPAVNTLVADLADDGETWTTDQWRNEHVDEALLQVVEDAFADGQHAMIVAGHSADDTRAAARYISEWRSHQDTLADAGMQYSPSSQEAPR